MRREVIHSIWPVRKKAKLNYEDQTGTQSQRNWDTKVGAELGVNWINSKAASYQLCIFLQETAWSLERVSSCRQTLSGSICVGYGMELPSLDIMR